MAGVAARAGHRTKRHLPGGRRTGEEVLTAVPVYPPFLSAPRLSGRGLATVPLTQAAGSWTFDFEQLEARITPHTRLFLLCNPHNPVGRVYTREELTRLALICDKAQPDNLLG